MSYAIDFDALDEKLFLLQQISLASEKYCEQELIGSDSDGGNFDTYWGWVKGIVSNYLIECAIKTRIFQDYLVENETKLDLNKIDRDSRNGLSIGIIHEGHFELTLRESCNKIIHAKKSIPSWIEKSVDGVIFKHWSGNFDLYGTKGNQNWHLEIKVSNWAKAMSRYHQTLSDSDGRIYVGQDW